MKEVRKAAGMTGEQFGGLLDVEKQTVSAWENGRNDPPTAAILLLSERGKVTTDYILRGRASESVDELEKQLLFFFRGVQNTAQDSLLQIANELYNLAHPERSVANPYGRRPSGPKTAKRTDGDHTGG